MAVGSGVRCGTCGLDAPPGNRFCGRCGAPLPGAEVVTPEGPQSAPPAVAAAPPDAPAGRLASIPPERRTGLAVLGGAIAVCAILVVLAVAFALRPAQDDGRGSGSALPPAGIDAAAPLFGMWHKADPTSRSISRLSLEPRGDQVRMVWWGVCAATDSGECGPYEYVEQPGAVLVFTTDEGFATKDWRIERVGAQLEVQTHTHFTDSSGRAHQDGTEYLYLAG